MNEMILPLMYLGIFSKTNSVTLRIICQNIAILLLWRLLSIAGIQRKEIITEAGVFSMVPQIPCSRGQSGDWKVL